MEDPLPGEQLYHSYQSLEKETGGDSNEFKKISKEETIRLEKKVRDWYKDGFATIFRTAINAETLYLFRQNVKAIKEFSLKTLHGREILFIRDQTEGFYANTNYNVDEKKGEIHFEGKYTKSHQQEVIKYAIRQAEEKFKHKEFEKWAIYKYHLFGDALKEWAVEVDKDMIVYQPDTGLTELHRFFNPMEKKPEPKQLLVVCSNEVGDIIYESLIEGLDLEAKLMFHSKNIYMAKPFEGSFGDFQTVHGSADDKVLGEGRAQEEEILPYSTLYAAAEVAEQYLKLPETRNQMDVAISIARRGSKRTEVILQTIFSHFNIQRNG